MMSARFATQAPEAAEALAPLLGATDQARWTPEDIRRLQPPRGFVLADVGRRHAVALVSLAADEAELLDIGVLPAHRGRGVGRALLAALCRLAVQHGARRLILEVATDNAPARALYAGAGLAPVGGRPAYYRRPDGTRVDALILARTLVAEEAPG